MQLKVIVWGLALAGLVTSVSAQSMQRVEVTGSSIKRLADEGALPLQVITAEQIQQLGVTTAADLLGTLSANSANVDNAISRNNVFGAEQDRLTGGSTFANLRGLGPTGTLVLLNGRRVSTHGMSGGAVDLNTIPMAAVARVEVLKDGASAIYGTDAIGGVINFILRTDFRGELFEGSQYLLAWADNLVELKTICHTGRKANMVVRVDEHGRAVTDGPQVEVGGNECYVSVSRPEFKKIMAGESAIELQQAVLPLDQGD